MTKIKIKDLIATFLIILFSAANATVLTVPDPFTRIQDAINHAQPGDTVSVWGPPPGQPPEPP